MEDFSCKSVRRTMWDYLGGSLDEVERHAVGYHLQECPACELHRKEIRSLRSGLRHIPAVDPPAMLCTRLRVIASRERARQSARRDLHSRLTEMRLRIRLFVDNLLKPFAVPAAGGILASFLCFGATVDNLHLGYDWPNDLPVGISTEVTIDELSPFSCGQRDVMVKLSVDSDGHVTDYELPPSVHASPEDIQEIGNLVLYSTFTPAVRAGWRVPSKRWVIMSHISVKG